MTRTEQVAQKKKTWGDLLKQFRTEYPALYSKMDDYRPFLQEYLPTNRPGIIIHMRNGDALVYIPKK